MLNLSSIIQRRRNDPIDDFHIVRSWKEYTDDRKYMKYLMYELEMMEDNGNVVHFYKAVKFTRIIRLPKSAKQSESFIFRTIFIFPTFAEIPLKGFLRWQEKTECGTS